MCQPVRLNDMHLAPSPIYLRNTLSLYGSLVYSLFNAEFPTSDGGQDVHDGGPLEIQHSSLSSLPISFSDSVDIFPGTDRCAAVFFSMGAGGRTRWT